ncbi:hypothetical protein [Granulicoccus sp. GXG6511]|uniref:hypothetical protein n=1 Tax=Granulicoccus sp. GXG6511 TaxID=3381351 RepID=UPI003D7E7ADA
MHPASLTRRVVQLALVLAVALITIGQILRPGLNQDVRYVIGVLDSAGAAGVPWTEVWAHRPMAARGVVALLAALSPGEFWVQEVAFRTWCVAFAAGAAVVLWRGVRGWSTPRVALWSALAVGAALAWAPGWDFAEPEWFAAVLAVAAIGLALWAAPTAPAEGAAAPLRHSARWQPAAAGLLLGLVVLLKFTTAATALAALLVILVVDRDRAIRAAIFTGLSATGLLALTVLLEPREWQWIGDMPTLNPGFSAGALPKVVEGLVNSAIVSPATLVGLVAIGWLLLNGGRDRRVGFAALAVLVVLTVPFLVQQQNFLYHLAGLPMAAAGLTGAVAARCRRLPSALPITAILGLLSSVGVFAIGPRTRSANWWVGAAVVAAVLVIGLALLARRRRARGVGRAATVLLIAVACLAPLVVTASPRTAYSFSLAHNRTTPADNLGHALAGADRRERVRAVLPGDDRVVYLSFAAPYWVGNPSPCAYVSPTFLQRAHGQHSGAIAATTSYAENLACLDDPSVQAIVIEPGWFDLDRARPEVRAGLRANFDCGRRIDVEDLVICPRR